MLCLWRSVREPAWLELRICGTMQSLPPWPPILVSAYVCKKLISHLFLLLVVHITLVQCGVVCGGVLTEDFLRFDKTHTHTHTHIYIGAKQQAKRWQKRNSRQRVCGVREGGGEGVWKM